MLESEEKILSENTFEEDFITHLSRNLEEKVIKFPETLNELSMEEIFTNLFDILPIGISFIDEAKSITKFNPALLKILQIDQKGLLRGDYRNRKYITKDGTALSQKDMPSFRALKEQKKISDEEIGVIIESGSTIWVSITALPISASRVIAITKDITGRKINEQKLKSAHEELKKYQNSLEEKVKERTLQLEQANHKMSTISRAIEQSPDSIVITDEDGNIEYVNPKFTEITGYSFEEAIGKNPRIMKSGRTNPQVYHRLWKTIKNGGEWKGILYNKRKNGELFWESVHISPVRDTVDKIINFVAIKEDITDKKKKEELLIKLNRTLRALNLSGEAMMKASNESDYLTEVGRIVVKDCGHASVWIGIYNKDKVEQVLSLPEDISGFNFIIEQLYKDISQNNGNIIINRGFQIVDKSNYSSSVLLPLKNNDGSAIGFLSIYSVLNDAFSTEEVDLLSQLADDLAYGITTLRLRGLNKIAEEELKKHRDELEQLVFKRTEELQVSNTLLEEAQSIAHFGHWHLNIKTNKLSWSNEVYRIFGVSFKDFGCNLESFLDRIYPEDRDKVTKAYLDSVKNHKPYSIEHRIVTSDKKIKIVKEQCTTHYSSDGDPMYSLGVVQDITELKKFEEEVKNHKIHLEELVRKRTEQLNSTNRQLKAEIEREKNIEFLLKESLSKEKELNELKSRFISTTSHEFRTPLTAILSSVQLIQRYREKWDDVKLEQQFLRVKNSIAYLTNLLDDTLTLSQAGSGKILFNPKLIDLQKVCNDIIEEVKHKSGTDHKLLFKFESERHEFQLDEKLVRMILLNLLSNAFKYSSGGKVKFYITVDKEIKITISDEGIGIPSEDQEHLFSPFFRARNSGEVDGTGLGLSIVKQCVELHHGTIEFFSALGKGTKFIVKLPR